MISFRSSGSTQRTEDFLRKVQQLDVRTVLNTAGSQGVAALSAATPADSGRASTSWGYEIKSTRTGFSIIWTNSDIESGFPVAIMLQYGYATGSGGYVAGRDYINPAIRPVMDRIAADVWKAVTNG